MAGVSISELPQSVRLIGRASQEVTITRIILQLQREGNEVTYTHPGENVGLCPLSRVADGHKVEA